MTAALDWPRGWSITQSWVATQTPSQVLIPLPAIAGSPGFRPLSRIVTAVNHWVASTTGGASVPLEVTAIDPSTSDILYQFGWVQLTTGGDLVNVLNWTGKIQGALGHGINISWTGAIPTGWVAITETQGYDI